MSKILTPILLSLFISYFYGGYQLFTAKQYSSKQLIGGLIFPPYAVYIGIDVFFKEKSRSQKCIDLEYEKTVEELLGNKNIKLLFDADLSKDEIRDVATVQRDKNIEKNCRVAESKDPTI